MKYDELFALLRRRGVLWPTAEIYGGAQGLYDYGPAGAQLKRLVEEAWAAWFIGLSDDFYRIDPAEILPEAVVRASGHLENFTDPEISCAKCENHFRAETILEKWRPEGVDGLSPAQIGELLKQFPVRCPHCGSTELSMPRPFNMMFGFDFGAAGGERAYLRPETAQSSYLAFARMWDVGRHALPLGIGVIGKAYRNEIAPRQVLFRLRAFTQAELQVFFNPAGFSVPFASVADEQLPVLRAARRLAGDETPELLSARSLVEKGLPEFYVYFLVHLYQFLRDVLRYPADAIRLFEKSETERAFYNRIQFDFEVRLESLGGYKEVGAVHYRGDYDLSRHSTGSGKDLAVVPPASPRLLPHVLEVTFGVDRNIWALADLGLVLDGDRTVWRLPAYLAPSSVGVFPLMKKEHSAEARRWVGRLRRAGVSAEFDASGSIGRRYARMDEIGVPYCVTIDHESLETPTPESRTATLRERDSKQQERVTFDTLLSRLQAARVAPQPASWDGVG
ncbi:MAG TPA: glycine--tRNA ligase [Thermoplasmata archaeon]|nr:glycine--tRNA ligase [Thermoplasmata archaeon]